MTPKILKNKKIRDKIYASFGEIMLRFSPLGFERFMQSSMVNATFGGGEANVAASLALQGLQSRFITVLPENTLGREAERFLKGFGVDTTKASFKEKSRIGTYYMEKGANQRPSKVIYDRENSAIASMESGVIDWDDAFTGCGWYHITGITPALSLNAQKAALNSMKKAHDLGIVVSCDLNFRAKLWNYGVTAPEVMSELAGLSDIVIANEEDCQKSLGIGMDIDPSGGEISEDRYRELSDAVLNAFPNLQIIAITLRESVSASHNRWGACINDRSNIYFSKKYDITDIVDRVGGGDSFCAGLICGLSNFETKEEALDYAVAASTLAHSIEGDLNLSSHEEIMNLYKGDSTGRIKR